MTLTLELPAPTDQESGEQREKRLQAAIALYDAGLVPQGSAAELAGLSRAAFLDPWPVPMSRWRNIRRKKPLRKLACGAGVGNLDCRQLPTDPARQDWISSTRAEYNGARGFAVRTSPVKTSCALGLQTRRAPTKHCRAAMRPRVPG